MKNIFTLFFLFYISISISNAAARTWTGTTNSDWFTSSNWGGAAVPTSGDDVTIPAGLTNYPLIGSGTANAKTIILAAGAGAQPTLIVYGAATLTIAGNLTINNGTVYQTGGTFNVTTGAVSITGKFDQSAGNFLPSVTVTVNNAGQLIQSGSGTIHLASALGTTPSDNLVVAAGGQVVQSGGSLEIKDFTSSSSATDAYAQSGGTLKIYHDYKNSGTFNATGGTIEFSANGGGNSFNAPGTNQFYNVTIPTGITKDFDNDVSTLLIRGNFTNNGTANFTAKATTVTFNGTSAQTIGGSTTTTFRGMVMNGSGGVTLNTPVNINATNGSLTMTNGILTTSLTNLLTFNDNATTSGGSSTTYITGPVKKVGNDLFEFPLGKNGVYAPLSIGAPDNAADALRAEYKRESGTGLGNISVAGLYRVSNCEYWDLDEITDAGSATSVILTMGWGTSSGCSSIGYITDYTSITIAHFNKSTSVWDSYVGSYTIGASSNSVGSASCASVNAFGAFTFGSTMNDANPLPVKLGNLKAFEKQQGIQLEWTAYTELNMDKYEVERSADGINFTRIGEVKAFNATTEKLYNYLDTAPIVGTGFYRLKNVDIDGKSGFSNIIRINLDKTSKYITLYPNPVQQSGSISFQASELTNGIYSAMIFNSTGQQVYITKFEHTGGAFNQSLQLPSTLGPGIYMFHLKNENKTYSIKAFKIR